MTRSRSGPRMRHQRVHGAREHRPRHRRVFGQHEADDAVAVRGFRHEGVALVGGRLGQPASDRARRSTACNDLGAAD